MLDFHPIHVLLNSADMAPYEALKRAVRPLNEATAEQMAPFVHGGIGAGSAFKVVAERLGRHGGGLRMRDVYDLWAEGRALRASA